MTASIVSHHLSQIIVRIIGRSCGALCNVWRTHTPTTIPYSIKVGTERERKEQNFKKSNSMNSKSNNIELLGERVHRTSTWLIEKGRRRSARALAPAIKAEAIVKTTRSDNTMYRFVVYKFSRSRAPTSRRKRKTTNAKEEEIKTTQTHTHTNRTIRTADGVCLIYSDMIMNQFALCMQHAVGVPHGRTIKSKYIYLIIIIRRKTRCNSIGAGLCLLRNCASIHRRKVRARTTHFQVMCDCIERVHSMRTLIEIAPGRR